MNKSRFDKGVVISASKRIRRVNDSVSWQVESSSPGKFYNVTISCDCSDFVYRNNICKHCYAVLIHDRGAVR